MWYSYLVFYYRKIFVSYYKKNEVLVISHLCQYLQIHVTCVK